MSVVSVCKNVIAGNNKRNWVDPEPAIRVSGTKSGKVLKRSNEIRIKDKFGNVVAVLKATTDGKALVKCGAKVALITEYPVS